MNPKDFVLIVTIDEKEYLHLSDEMVALLKSGWINNRLLCELAAHKSDSESAPQTTIAEELKQDLEDIANFKGSPLEKQAALYCKRLGINYNKLSDVEFRQLVQYKLYGKITTAILSYAVAVVGTGIPEESFCSVWHDLL